MTLTLDFNHGAALPPDNPRAADISDRINAHIDAAFARKRAAEPARNYIGASGIGNECLRAAQFASLHVPPDPGRITGKSLRIFETGHVFEAAIGDWIKMAGFQLEIMDTITGGQFGWSVLDDDGQGHIDGKLLGGPVPMGYPALWECKALNAAGWQEVKKKGLAIAKPLYMGQVAINQAYLGLHEHPALFTVLNKNTSELHHELVPFDQQLAQDLSDKMFHVSDATDNKVLLPRAYSDPDFYKCKMCDFRTTCWEKTK